MRAYRYLAFILAIFFYSSISFSEEKKAPPNAKDIVGTLTKRIELIEQKIAKKNEDSPEKTNISPDRLLYFAKSIAVKSFSYHFVNVNSHMLKLKTLFTKQGYRSLEKNIITTEQVIKDKLVISAIPNGPPVILKEEIQNNLFSLDQYAWYVEVPLLALYSSSTLRESKNIIVTMKILKANNKTSKQILLIDSFTVKNNV